MEKLLRYDNHFADAHLVLGDELGSNGKSDLAALAWHRAKGLGHPRIDGLDLRIAGVAMHWNEAGVGVSRSELVAGVEHAMSQALRWTTAFQQAEAQLVGQGEWPTFEETEVALEATGVTRFRGESLDRWRVR